MKILIHTDEYYPVAQACANRMQVFADTFMALGDEVTVIASSANRANRSGSPKTHKETILYSPAVRMKKKTTFMRALNNLTFGITSVFTAAMAGRADVVITTSPPALVSIPGWIIAKIKRAVLVYDVRDIWPDVAIEMGSLPENGFASRVFRSIAAFMYKHADIVTTVTEGKAEKIRRYIGSLPGYKSSPDQTDKVWLVGNGFDEKFAESEMDPSLADQYELDQKFTVVYIGNIGIAQALGTLLDVASKTKHRDIRFLCFGTGAEKEMLEQRAKNEELSNVRFCGLIEHSKVYSVLSHARVSFIPLKSGRMKDSVPSKIFEALGIGCPVFLVALGEAAELVSETGAGRSVSPDEPDKIVEAFDDMIDHYSEYEAHRKKAIRLMREKYSRQKYSRDFIRRLHQFCGK